MTRHYAKKNYAVWTPNPLTREELIDKIYDDISSCDKCKHCYIGGSFFRCNKQNELTKRNKDYCSDFEEKL